MGIPTWTPGEVLASADVNAWFVPLAVVKPSDTARSTNTSLTNDPDLTLAVAASCTYDFRCLVIFTASSGGDIQWTWSVPSGATMRYQCVHNEGGGTGVGNSAVIDTAAFTGFAAGGGGTTNEGLLMDGTFTTSSTSGNLVLQWAQNASNAGATTVRALSKLMLRRLA
jgi:hypothetical protein